MTSLLSQIYKGVLKVDLSPFDNILLDLPSGATQTFRTEQPGYPAVRAELKASVDQYGAKAGISPEVYASYTECDNTIAKLDEVIVIVLKLAEVLRETRAKLDHDRQNYVSIIAESVRSMARRQRDSSIAAPFEKTIEYHGQIGRRAAKTRKQKLEAKDQEAKDQEAKDQEAKDQEAKDQTETSPKDAPKTETSPKVAPKTEAAAKAPTKRATAQPEARAAR